MVSVAFVHEAGDFVGRINQKGNDHQVKKSTIIVEILALCLIFAIWRVIQGIKVDQVREKEENIVVSLDYAVVTTI